jgi:hypothetical protein
MATRWMSNDEPSGIAPLLFGIAYGIAVSTLLHALIF